MQDNRSLGLLTAARMLAASGKPSSQQDLLRYGMQHFASVQIAKSAYDVGRSLDDKHLHQAGFDFFANLGSLQELENITKKNTQKLNLPYQTIPNRVCYMLHNALPYASGGYATRGHGVALGLKKQGFDVICVTRPGFPIDLPGYEDYDHDVVESTVDNVRYSHILQPSRKDYGNWEYLHHATNALVAKFATLRPEVVIAASNNLTALPALLAARRLGIAFHYEVRGFWEITRVSREPAFIHSKTFANQKRFEILAAASADHVFTLTTPMKEELMRRKIPADNITLVPNSCDPTQFTPRKRDEKLAAHYNIPPGVPVIGYIGTFVQYEGLDDLVRACALLHDEGQDFRLLLVGNENASGREKGPLMTEIERLTSESGFGEKILMPGRIPHDDVAAHYSLLDIAPFPRKPQPVTEMVSPMKPLEALAMEKAVLVSSVRALSEMVQDGETGRIFEKGSVNDMARVLRELIKDPTLRQRLGKNGRRWVEEERTWDRTTAIFAQELRASITKRAQTPSHATFTV